MRWKILSEVFEVELSLFFKHKIINENRWISNYLRMYLYRVLHSIISPFKKYNLYSFVHQVSSQNRLSFFHSLCKAGGGGALQTADLHQSPWRGNELRASILLRRPLTKAESYTDATSGSSLHHGDNASRRVHEQANYPHTSYSSVKMSLYPSKLMAVSGLLKNNNNSLNKYRIFDLSVLDLVNQVNKLKSIPSYKPLILIRVALEPIPADIGRRQGHLDRSEVISGLT